MIKLKVRGVTIGYSTYKKKQREQVERDLEIKLKNKQYCTPILSLSNSILQYKEKLQ